MLFLSLLFTTIYLLLFISSYQAPSKIPYYFSASKEHPGKFLLSYAPKMKPRHEFMTVTPDGIRFRQQIHHSLNACINWFKEHFRVGFYDAYVVPEELFCSRLLLLYTV